MTTPSRALVVGASGGIGSAVATALDQRGTEVTALSRSKDHLDVTDEAAVERALGSLTGPFGLIFVATGALELGGARPEKTIRELTPARMRAQFDLNTLGPTLVLKHGTPLLPRSGRSVFAALSARVGSIGDNRLGGWYAYRASKAALNQVIRTGAIELSRTRPENICVALHPGTVHTALTEKYVGNRPAVTPVEAAMRLLDVIEGLTPMQSGGFFDYAGNPVPW